MSLEVYNDDFSDRYEISHAISVQMSHYYNDVGKLTLVTAITAYNASALKNDRILYDTQLKIAFIIKNVKIDTKENRITANGFTTNHILNSRVVASPVTISNVESGVYAIVNENLRGLERVTTAPIKGITNVTSISVYGKTVLDQIMPLLSGFMLGHRMTWNHRTKEHVFEVYQGKDLTYGNHAVTFSDEQGTARELVIDDDASKYKNVAYVVSKYNNKEIVEIVRMGKGEDREQWFEASLSAKEGETESEFRNRMRFHGETELGKLIERQSFSVVIDPAELGVLYNIGDNVSCVSKRFGVKFNARISGVKYKKDANSETTEVVLGEPKLTLIGEVLLSGRH